VLSPEFVWTETRRLTGARLGLARGRTGSMIAAGLLEGISQPPIGLWRDSENWHGASPAPAWPKAESAQMAATDPKTARWEPTLTTFLRFQA
jgi:hypothetical protein